MWERVSSQPIFIVFLGDFHRDHGETELTLSVKTSVIDLQRILGSDGRCVQGRKTQEEVHGMETGKQMAIQRPVYLPKINSEVQQTQEPPHTHTPPPQSRSVRRTELILRDIP